MHLSLVFSCRSRDKCRWRDSLFYSRQGPGDGPWVPHRVSTRQSKGKECRIEAETEIRPRTFWRFSHKHTLGQGKSVWNCLLVWTAMGSGVLGPSGVLWYPAGNNKFGTQGGLECKVLDSFVHMWKTWLRASSFLSLEMRRQSVKIQKKKKIK